MRHQAYILAEPRLCQMSQPDGFLWFVGNSSLRRGTGLRGPCLHLPLGDKSGDRLPQEFPQHRSRNRLR